MEYGATMTRPALVCLAALAACSHAPAQPSPAQPPPAARDPLAYVPASANVVVTIDFKQLRASKLYGQYQPILAKALADDVKKCGYDPLATLDSLTIGIGASDAQSAAVLRGLDRDRTLACLQAGAFFGVPVTRDGNTVTFEKNHVGHTIVFVDAQTAVFVGSSDRAAVDKLIAAGAPLRASPEFIASYDKLGGPAAISFVTAGDMDVFRKTLFPLAYFAHDLRAAYGTIRVDDGLALSLHGVVDTAEHADHLVATIQPQLAGAKAYVAKLDVKADGPVVTGEVEMSAAQLTQLGALWGQVLAGSIREAD
jgi:hypothetical protein